MEFENKIYNLETMQEYEDEYDRNIDIFEEEFDDFEDILFENLGNQVGEKIEYDIEPYPMDELDNILFLQIKMMNYLINRWSKTYSEFLELDEKYSVLWYIRIGYESFHLMGEERIARELEKFIVEQGGEV